MYNKLVMHRSEAPVGAALAALADPTRREMVELLAERPRRVGELVAAFPVSQPAISRHLRVLRQHGLIEDQRPDGDRRFWAGHLEQFRSFVEQETAARPEEGP